jgi:hypothetical protein
LLNQLYSKKPHHIAKGKIQFLKIATVPKTRLQNVLKVNICRDLRVIYT